jgi:hypothetical protein
MVGELRMKEMKKYIEKIDWDTLNWGGIYIVSGIILILSALAFKVSSFTGVDAHIAFFIFGLGAVVGIFLAGLIALFMDAKKYKIKVETIK